jgi:predicted enzyme related to lactoylglutathione lyase
VITGVGKVVVHTDDQERAREFWAEQVGFDIVRDETYGDERWIEVAPPAGAPVLVLTPRGPGDSRPEVPDEKLPHSPVMFTCEDVQATHRDLSARGVEFPTPPAQLHFGWWALFADPDGTRYALGQWG